MAIIVSVLVWARVRWVKERQNRSSRMLLSPVNQIRNTKLHCVCFWYSSYLSRMPSAKYDPEQITELSLVSSFTLKHSSWKPVGIRFETSVKTGTWSSSVGAVLEHLRGLALESKQLIFVLAAGLSLNARKTLSADSGCGSSAAGVQASVLLFSFVHHHCYTTQQS